MKIEYKFSKKVLKDFLSEFWFAPSDALLRCVEKVIWDNFNFSGKVLDIGTGDGRNSTMLFEGKKIDYGIDPDPRVIILAKKCGIYKKVLLVNANKLPFKDKSFETVVSNSTFEHMTDDLASIKEVSRILNDGGNFYLSVPTPRFEKEFIKNKTSKKYVNWYNKRVLHYHYRSLKDWTEILKENNLKICFYQYYFTPVIFKIWFKLFKISVFRPYHRELWSYLKDSPYGKMFPKRIIVNILEGVTWKQFQNSIGNDGTWVFIMAQKI